MGEQGLFVGLVTVDLTYLTESGPPQPDQKLVALDTTISTGGPATNAAVTFSHLGGKARLLSVVGTHPIHQWVRADLADQGVTLVDLDPSRWQPPPISSIMVTQGTGERAIVSLNALKAQASPEQIPAQILQGIEIVLIDGHQMEVAAAIAQQARSQEIPVVVDGGSWKPGFERVLPFVDYALCSQDFYPPGCQTRDQVVDYLTDIGVPKIAITCGHQPIQFMAGGKQNQIEVPQIQAVDTSGAGDIFHGAFCHFILHQSFPEALAAASEVASRSCQFLGTRSWLMNDPSV